MQSIIGRTGLRTCGPLTSLSGVNQSRAFAHKARTEPEKSVFISQSSDVHTNLALEHWLYRHFDFKKHRVLLLCQNDPCVVIGRHQNPWTEVDMDKVKENKISFVRRPSGGGSVFYDKGNLNCTFFSPGHLFDRKSNLEIICRALERQFGIQTEISPRLEVNLQGYKMSGTASKLGKNAYHQCTLLVDADLKKLTSLLNPINEGRLEGRDLKSVKSSLQNLTDVNPSVSLRKAISSIGYEFLRTLTDGQDGGVDLIEKQRGFKLINPTDDWFPGLDALKAELKGWNWTFGTTPEFTFKKEYLLGIKNGAEPVTVQLNLDVKKGFIKSAILALPKAEQQVEYIDGKTMSDLSGFIDAVKQRPFHEDVVYTFEDLLFNRANSEPLSVHETLDHREFIQNSYGV